MASKINPINSNTNKHRQAIIIIIAGLMILLTLATYLPAYKLNKSYQANIIAQQLKLQKLQQASAQLNELQQKAQHIAENVSGQLTDFIEGETHALAAAKLQQILKQLIESSGGGIQRFQPINTENNTYSPYDAVTLYIQTEANIVSLQQLLHKIALHKPLLFIRKIHIENQTYNNYTQIKTPPKLGVRLTIEGYRHNDNGQQHPAENTKHISHSTDI